jgi:hypothetical protein
MTEIPLCSPAKAVIPYLLKLHPDISSIRLIQYPPIPTFHQVAPTLPIFEEALERRLRHGGKPVTFHDVSRDEVGFNKIDHLLNFLPNNTALAVCSVVILKNKHSAHIPMLDFQCQKSEENLKYISAAMLRVESEGIIVASPHSYHFYGKSLLTNEKWTAFIGRSLLLEPLIDVRYLGHCLLDGFAALRVSEYGGATGNFPRVIAKF